MSRILEIAPEKLTPEQTTIFNQLVAGRGRILGPYKIWIHSPTIASGMEHIGTHLNKRGSLSPRRPLASPRPRSTPPCATRASASSSGWRSPSSR